MTEQKNSDYLIFRWGQEFYGVPLLAVQEVVKFKNAKPLPYTTKELVGVVNLRGQIISVIDLAARLDLGQCQDKNRLMLIVATNPDNHLGVLIDDITCVHSFGENEIDNNPAVDTKINRQFLIGIGKKGSQLIHLLDIPNFLLSIKFTRAA